MILVLVGRFAKKKKVCDHNSESQMSFYNDHGYNDLIKADILVQTDTLMYNITFHHKLRLREINFAGVNPKNEI